MLVPLSESWRLLMATMQHSTGRRRIKTSASTPQATAGLQGYCFYLRSDWASLWRWPTDGRATLRLSACDLSSDWALLESFHPQLACYLLSGWASLWRWFRGGPPSPLPGFPLPSDWASLGTDFFCHSNVTGAAGQLWW